MKFFETKNAKFVSFQKKKPFFEKIQTLCRGPPFKYYMVKIQTLRFLRLI